MGGRRGGKRRKGERGERWRGKKKEGQEGEKEEEKEEGSRWREECAQSPFPHSISRELACPVAGEGGGWGVLLCPCRLQTVAGLVFGG